MLLTVRLGPKEEQIVRGLKRRRVNVSALVRRTLLNAAENLSGSESPAAALEEILREIPIPKPRRGVKRPPSDAPHELHAHIRDRLRKP